MDEYNSTNFEFEPMEEEPGYQRPDPRNYVPYETYQPRQEPEKPRKKDRTTAKIVALVAAVAILGSVGGSLLTSAINRIHKDEAPSISQSEVEAPEQGSEPDAPAEGYTTVTHDLPDTLTSNNAGKSLTPSQVYENTVNSVVGIQTEATTNIFGQEAVSASAGSGFILSADGYVITNAHVVNGADSITVDLYNGESYEAQLVGADSDFDIAVLKIDAEGLQPVSVGNSDKLKVGEEVAAIGNPLGELTFTMTNGILSALDREINTDGTPQNMLQTNAAINSGNSGGPLFDMDGNVIGVTTAKYSGSTNSGTTIEGLGFAIPINTALKVAYDLAEYGYVKGQAFLGITVKTLDSQTAEYYSLPAGPRVEAIKEGSCAEKAGMQVGDIVVEFNGVKTATHPELLSALKKVSAGDTVEVIVFRAGAEMKFTVTLDEKPRQEEVDAQVEEYEQQQRPSQQEPSQVQPVFPDENQGDGFFYQFPFSQFGFPFG